MPPAAPSSGLSAVSPFAVSVDVSAARVEVTGELVRESAHHLIDALTVLTVQPGRRWRLDAAGVTFCDAGGVRALSSAHTMAAEHGRTLQLERPSRSVSRLVELVGPDRVFPATTGTSPRRAAGARTWVRRIGCGTTGTA